MDDKTKDKVVDALTSLVSTPSGWIFILGSVQIIGSSFVVYKEGFDDLIFAYVDIGIGSLFVLAAIVMWSVKAMKEGEREDREAERRIRVMELDAQVRRERREAGQEDKTIYFPDRRSKDQ